MKKTIAHWRAFDACPDVPDILYVPATNPQDRTQVRRERFGPCKAGTEVVLYVIEGGGHTWPGGPLDDSWPFLGKVTRKVSATEAAWTFFSEHPKVATAPRRLATQPSAPLSDSVEVERTLVPPLQTRVLTRRPRTSPVTLLTTTLNNLLTMVTHNILTIVFGSYASVGMEPKISASGAASLRGVPL